MPTAERLDRPGDRATHRTGAIPAPEGRRLPPCGSVLPEGQQLAIDVASQDPRQLKRVTLATAEETVDPERRRDDVDGAHVLTISLRLPAVPGGGPRQHRRACP
jgi:hypothetical protein